jgi:HK97 family phage major capsid protein
MATHRAVDLREVSTTWMPAYSDAAILAVRSEEGDAPVSDQEIITTPEPDVTAVERQMSSMTTRMGEQFDKLADRLEKMEERNRSEFSIPATVQTAPEIPSKGVWTQSVLRMLSGERIPEMQMRALADLVTTDNIGVVPPAYLTEIIGVINRRRPFLESTRRLGTPASGMSLVVPRIVTRPTVGIQVAEKDELTSTKTEIDTVTFDAVTKGGAGDISLQLLKRSDPSFLSLYLELLFEAYALDAEQEAVAALLGLGSGGFGSGGFGNGGVNDGGSLDPEHANFGDAWINGYETMYGGPDTIWLSSEAVGAFIDAKADSTNQPLYWTLQANFSMPGGVGGNISGMRPVHVPALNGTGVDILVGPSNGFGWAEDGTYTLQVDVPAKAGRDVAVVGILWFCPLYPTAFTGWALGGS